MGVEGLRKQFELVVIGDCDQFVESSFVRRMKQFRRRRGGHLETQTVGGEFVGVGGEFVDVVEEFGREERERIDLRKSLRKVSTERKGTM